MVCGNPLKNTSSDMDILSARPNRTAAGAELTAIFFDQRGIAAFLAMFACDGFVHSRAALLFGDFEHTHLLRGIAVCVEDAEHGVTVDDEPCNVRNSGRIAFHFGISRYASHEVAQWFAEVEQLAQLHAYPRRVDHAHV